MSIARHRWPEVISRRIAGQTLSAIAEGMGVHVSSIGHTIAEPEVKDQIAAANRDIIESTKSAIVSATPVAVSALVDILRDDTSTAADRIKAAIAILDRGEQRPGSTVEISPASVTDDQLAARLSRVLAGSDGAD